MKLTKLEIKLKRTKINSFFFFFLMDGTDLYKKVENKVFFNENSNQFPDLVEVNTTD